MTKIDGSANFWVVLFHDKSKSESYDIFEKMRPLAENPFKEIEFLPDVNMVETSETPKYRESGFVSSISTLMVSKFSLFPYFFINI